MDRVPPHNIEAEQSVLGSMMLDRSAAEKAIEILQTIDFYRPAHQEIFDSLFSLTLKDEPVDMITLSEELKKRNKLDDCGGGEYLIALVETVPTAANVEYYSKIVEQKSTLRKLIQAASQITSLAHKEDEEIEDITEKAEQLVFSVGQKRMGEFFRPITPLINSAWEWIDKRHNDKGISSGISTGFNKIDSLTNGFQPSDFIILAARPSMGKTALALDMGVNAALRGGQSVAIFSLEMSAEQLVQRMLCAEAKADAHRLRSGHFRDDEWGKLADAASRLYDAPIYIDDSTGTSSLAMRAKCRRLKAEKGLGLVIVDYLQLMQSSKKTENRQQEISDIARGLKSLAREMRCPVVALSQLSRAVEKRDDKRPMLSDLRESGSLEAEADLVAMLYRAEYYNKKEISDVDALSGKSDRYKDPSDKQLEVTEIIIAKHRNGPTGTVRIGFIPEFASFQNLAEGYDE